MDIRTSINTRPMSPYQWLIIAVITYLNALDGYDLVATAFAAPHLAEEFAIGSSLLGGCCRRRCSALVSARRSLGLRGIDGGVET